MIKRTVRKGHRRFWPVMWGIQIGRKITRSVQLWNSSEYMLDGPDQQDWNKVFGLIPIKWGHLWYLLTLRRPHHYESYRFVYRYYAGELQGAFYWYQKGVRGWVEFGDCRGLHGYAIAQELGNIVFRRNGQEVARVAGQLTWICFRNSPVFGGNQRAPKDIDVWVG